MAQSAYAKATVYRKKIVSKDSLVNKLHMNSRQIRSRRKLVGTTTSFDRVERYLWWILTMAFFHSILRIQCFSASLPLFGFNLAA